MCMLYIQQVLKTGNVLIMYIATLKNFNHEVSAA
jgi:hypothetical protein